MHIYIQLDRKNLLACATNSVSFCSIQTRTTSLLGWPHSEGRAKNACLMTIVEAQLTRLEDGNFVSDTNVDGLHE